MRQYLCSVFSVLKTMLNIVFSWSTWKEGEVLQFLHAIKMFSLEIEGLSQGRKKVGCGRGERISLTVAPHSQKWDNCRLQAEES